MYAPTGVPYLQVDHPINLGLVTWIVATGRGARNIGPGAAYQSVVNSGVTIENNKFGPTFRCDASANGYVEVLPGGTGYGTGAITISWIEATESGAANYSAIACLSKGAAANRFLMIRSTDGTIDASHYGYFACGTGPITRSAAFLPPSMASRVGLPASVWVLVCAGGLASTTVGNFTLYVDGVKYAASQGGGFGLAGTGFNYFGWDGADAKFKGQLNNLRVWNRALTFPEIAQLTEDPFIGGRPRRRIELFAATNLSRPNQYFYAT